MRIFHATALFLLPGLLWGSCFSDRITKIVDSGKTYKAKVIANKSLSANACTLTLSISGTKITGEAKGRLCRTSKNKIVKVNVRARCCDTPPCDKNMENKIWFTEPRLALKAAKPAMATIAKSAPKQQARPTSGSGVLSAPKSIQPKPKPRVIKNETRVASSASRAVGNGTATVIAKSSPPPSQIPTTSSTTLASTSAEPEKPATPLDQYKVELGVDGQIQKPGPPGELTVWIGDPKFSANFSAEMATTETTVAAIGQSAKVTPYAPNFDVIPKESICFEVDPSGSHARFAITPKSTGTFKVGADVLLYKSNECTGLPVPKSATTLKVEVVVNKEGVAKNYFLQLWDVLWQGILDFWKWVVATIFALLVFLIRKQLKKLFNFDA